MTDEQFEKFIAVVSQKEKDHDLLVEINTIVRLNHDSYEKDKVESATKVADAKKTADTAHKRIDYLYTGVMVSVGGLILSVIIFFLTHKPTA